MLEILLLLEVCERKWMLPIRFAEAFAMGDCTRRWCDCVLASDDLKLCTTSLHLARKLRMTGNGLKDTLQSAVRLNKEHQYALNVYTERLEIELEAVDKLIVRFFIFDEVVVIQIRLDSR